MKKVISVILLGCVLLLCGCTGRRTMEENDANAPVTVEDTGRATTAAAQTTAGVTSPLTGRPVLEPLTFSVPDPENSRGLPTAKIGHSYGVAKGGKVHDNSKNAQSFFDSKGYRALCYDTTTGTKALYLTFDCGWENGYTAKVLDTLLEKKVPAAFFCTLEHIESQPDLIARMITEGHIVGNHSAKHPDFAKISRERMAAELLECNNYLRQNFGYSTEYFRFPEGSYNESALDLVGSMGYTSVFWSCAYADWDVKAVKGGDYAFKTVTSRLHPGAVILLHSVSPDNAAALGDIIDFARSQGYEFKALSDYRSPSAQ